DVLTRPPSPPLSTLFPYTTLFRSVRTRDTMRRPELGLEVGEEREHRRLDLRFVLLAVRLEVSLVVVRAQAEEETLEVALPTRERSEEHTSELQSRFDLVCRLLLEK